MIDTKFQLPRIFLSFNLLFFLSVACYAQQIEKVPGELIVQLVPGYSIEETLQLTEGTPYEGKYKSLEMLSKRCGIWLIGYNTSQVTGQEALSFWKENPAVAITQFNHIIRYRKKPNDPRFNEQWDFENTGQMGGTPGADMQIADAWDLTTGGLTATGDTIVIAVIDDGVDIYNEDLVDNMWKNRDEIRNNNIDDDQNGKKDDYNGWDFYINSDSIFPGWHGTPVTSIIGAKGNNGKGIAGVNWNIKILPVAADVDEASAVAAYDYVLGFRVKYNQTGGSKGSFVVATNASWGIDFGQPDSMPIWCAFYDTLGKHGIINIAATMNLDENVDSVGDMPTACGSDFLISVTNTNRFDIKVIDAAYGKSTIDLGAPSEDGLGAYPSDFYNTFGGTSGAAPHVAGTIGLLYSSSCIDLIQDAKDYPDSIALIMKDFIISGTDPVSSLANKTVSGGRLNVFNSLLKAENYGSCFLASVDNGLNAGANQRGFLNLYPNPAEDYITVSYVNEKTGNNLFIITDAMGKKVLQTVDNIKWKGKQESVINIGSLPAGIYFIYINSGFRQSDFQKFIIK